MPVFDSHVHTFPDKVAAQAMAYLSGRSGVQPFWDGTRAGLLASMRAGGIDGALNCPIATRADQVESINRYAARGNAWPVLSLGSMHPDYPEPARELRAVRDLGLPGIKLHPEYQEFRLDDPRLRPVWQACADLGLVVVLHAGADIGFQPPYHSDPASIAALLDAYPRLRLVAAHFGSWRMWDEVARHLVGRELYLDVSFVFDCLPDDELARLIRRHGLERVLFATDAPWRDQGSEAARFRALGLGAEADDRILWRNAAGLFGFGDPAPAPANP